MDDCDVTQARLEAFEPHLIANSKKPEGPVANGYCHFCKEPVATGHRWCDEECRNDWQDEQAQRLKQGARP